MVHTTNERMSDYTQMLTRLMDAEAALMRRQWD